MRAILYRGEIAAIATGTKVFLAPPVDELPWGDPKLRFVAAMCLYSRDVDQGHVPGPYNAGEAELYARTLLVPDEEFEVGADRPDQELAQAFAVPLEQVAAKRRDLPELKNLDAGSGACGCGHGGRISPRGTHRD